MCCSKKISKLLLFIFNIIFFVVGAGILALGIFLVVDKNYLYSIIGKIPNSDTFDTNAVLSTTSFLENGAYVLIAAGAFIFIIAFCGLCGGIKESKCLLAVYAALVIVILILELATVVLYIVYRGKVENRLQLWIQTLITDYYSGATLGGSNVPVLSTDTTGVSEAIDYAQVFFGCCGAYNYTDYNSASNWPRAYNVTGSDGNVTLVTNAMVPVSCCMISNTGAWPSALDTISFVDVQACLTTASANSTNTGSCITSIKDYLVTYSDYGIGVGVTVIVIEVFGIMAALCLYKKAGKDD